MKKLEVDTQIQLLEAMLDGSKVGTIVTDPALDDKIQTIKQRNSLLSKNMSNSVLLI
ncbi:hypothetical protein [Planococcus sp. ISL-109]|uniref:hypothetical protein n=1 Tax=Planococcus sp. ISL-109 TaxID=2819166 RepID=UPI0020353391|nr:hypothetical protein [Planococcus sp. ISL-109]